MSIIDDLITDRTPADVASATVNRDSAVNNRGAWTPAFDGNRVEGATLFVYDILMTRGYGAYLDIKTDWTEYDNLYITDITRIRKNIDTLHNTFFTLSGWQTIVYNDTLTHEQANILEQNIQLLYYVTTGFNDKPQVGTITVGEDVFL